MHRAWKLALTLLCLALGVTYAAPALAFHMGDMFDEPPGAGGGGGITYGGLPSERGWTCAACHLDAPGKISVSLTSDPPALADGSYEPGRTYLLTATLVGEHEGLEVPAANFNSISINVVDAAGAPAGTLYGYAEQELYAHGPASVVSAGQRTGATSWVLSWQAPAADAGPLAIHVAAVDGNGAGGAGGGVLTDPFGDDVYVGEVTINPPAGASGSRDDFTTPWFAVVLGTWGLRRRLRGTRWPLFALALALTSCTDPTPANPCPQAICAASDAGAVTGDAGACVPSWTCSAWLPQGDGLYARSCIDTAHCGTHDGPVTGPLALPALDRDMFECAVEPILDRSCAMLACHGTETGRALKVYARGRLRLGPGTGTADGAGASPHTAAEWQSNYDSARAFMLGVDDADDSPLLQQPMVGGATHAGVHLLTSTSSDYLTIRDWLSGKTLGTACNPLPN